MSNGQGEEAFCVLPLVTSSQAFSHPSAVSRQSYLYHLQKMATNKAQDKNVVGQENVKMRVEQQEQIELVERRTLADMDDLDLENRNAAKPDDSDGKTDWHWRRVVAIVSLSGLYVSAQLPLQFAGGSMTYMDAEFRAGALTWLITGNNLSFAAMCPFAGYLADLLGTVCRSLCVGLSLTQVKLG